MTGKSRIKIGSRFAWIVPLALVALAAMACGGSGSGGGSSSGGGWSVPDDPKLQPVENEPVDVTWHVLIQRVTVGMQPSLSMECYTFYGDGFVELRHNGAVDATDVGTYSGDATSGTIAWDSGRSSWYEGAGSDYGSSYSVNDADGSVIDHCY